MALVNKRLMRAFFGCDFNAKRYVLSPSSANALLKVGAFRSAPASRAIWTAFSASASCSGPFGSILTGW
jgi:hypothetical protein